MQGQNVSKICKSITSFFNKSATKLAKQTGFVKRKSKLTAKLFFESLIIGCLANPRIVLEDMCRLLKKRDLKITKQGLHLRFNAGAVKLIKACYEEALNKFKASQREALQLLQFFTCVVIHDSSNISLPSALKTSYQGFGGMYSDAGLKIQALFDYTNAQVSSITLTGARRNDQSFTDHLDEIKEGGLYLQDLGYFNLESFEKISIKKAYFISRFLSRATLFNDNDEPINLLKLLQNSGAHIAKKVGIGKKKNKLQVRLVAYRLSEKDVEKRIRKIRKESKRKGRTPKQETLELAKWSICITNVPEDKLKDEQAYLLYSLRWQVELFFKLCKSGAGLDKINGRNHNRVMCEIYAKLICIVVFLYICFPVRWQENQEISLYKAYQQLHHRAYEFFTVLQSPYRLLKFLKDLLDDFKDFALKEKPRRKRLATYQKLMKTVGQEVLL